MSENQASLNDQPEFWIAENGCIRRVTFHDYVKHEISQSKIDRASIRQELDSLEKSFIRLERDQLCALNGIQTSSAQSSAKLSKIILQGINDAISTGRQKVFFQAALIAASVSFVLTALFLWYMSNAK